MAIHLYRPQRTPIETLLACNVGRSHFVESVLDDLRSRYSEDSRQHFMFIGPRGIGKTTLLRLIAHGITQDPDLATRYLPVALPEEGYSLSRVSDFMVHMVQILSQDLARDELTGVYDQVRHDDDHQRVVDRVVEAMRGFHRQTGLGVVLMFENAHRFLERQKRNKDELHLLRSLMMSETWLTGIFTSPTYLNALVDAKEPFFEFFKVLTLGELTQDELLEVLHKLTEHENNQVFREYLAKHSSRVRALYHFTGGNPRLALMLYELVTKHDIVGVREELDQLLDQITPFYQDRMKDLSEQEAKVIEAMSLIPEGCTPKDLARETRLGGGTTRMVLTRLENAGYVKHEKRSDRKTVYYIQERLFRIWNSMNNSRKTQGKIQYLLDFFSAWYATEEERAQIWNFLFQTIIKSNEAQTIKNATNYFQHITSITPGHEKRKHIEEIILAATEKNDIDAIREFPQLYNAIDNDYTSHAFIMLLLFITRSLSNNLQILHTFQSQYKQNRFADVLIRSLCEQKPDAIKIGHIFIEAIRNVNNAGTYSTRNLVFLLTLVSITSDLNKTNKGSLFCSALWSLIFASVQSDQLSHLIIEIKNIFPGIYNNNSEVSCAWDYISNSRSPAILEKHAPEVREAALKLVEAFDSNPANSPPGDPGSGS